MENLVEILERIAIALEKIAETHEGMFECQRSVGEASKAAIEKVVMGHESA